LIAEKWKPVFRKDHAQTKGMALEPDSTQLNQALDSQDCPMQTCDKTSFDHFFDAVLRSFSYHRSAASVGDALIVRTAARRQVTGRGGARRRHRAGVARARESVVELANDGGVGQSVRPPDLGESGGGTRRGDAERQNGSCECGFSEVDPGHGDSPLHMRRLLTHRSMM
jgi:hypothetical protein